MDHYKVLGISRTATKEQIKQAFRKLALQFHPDKHSLSPKPVREDATRRFKQAFEAYDVLIDDQKRDFYNHSSNINNSRNSYQNYGYRKRSSSTNEGYAGSYSRENYSRGSNVSRFEVVFRYMGTRSFLINLVFAGGLLGGSYFISSSGDALWKMRNSGKSFEEVMETREKTKEVKYEKV